MPTTVQLSNETRDRLARTKEVFGASSMDETVQRLLALATPSANDLFKANKRKVLAVCRKYGLTRLTAFGSRVRGDATPASDLDLVAVFPSGLGLFEVIGIQQELGEAFGCRVDLGALPRPGSRLAAHVEREGVVLAA